MQNIKIIVEYDGKDFNGWQKQPNKLNIQGEIERAIEEVTKEKVNLEASGRTDAGVHSLGQTANFKLKKYFPVEKIPVALNSQLKKSIRVKDATIVEEDFHSRYHCKEKTYQYIINNSKEGSAIYRNLQYHYPLLLNEKKMDEAIKYFIGEHDFAGFKSSGTSSKSSVRKILEANVIRQGDIITITLTGNGFLYNMVRIIAGTLLEVGEGKIDPKEIEKIMESKDRTRAGRTLPPQGLYLVNVKY